MKKFLTFVLIILFSTYSHADFQAPVIRTKMVMFNTIVSAGETVRDEPLGSLMTIQPMVLWNFPSINSRIGFHYLLDIASNYGFTPISGIGISGYYYLTGLPAAYETLPDDTLIQKSKHGFFTYASFTPVNFNLNRRDPTDPNSGKAFSFSAMLYDFTIGGGYEYPLKPNSLISVELAVRDASSGGQGGKLAYSGIGLGVTFTTSYY